MKPSTKLMNVSSRQMLAFLEICRLQSFARAAESISLSPSGVSMLVKELESQVGARLFDRTTRTVTLTEAGRRLQPVAECVVGELRSLQAGIGGVQAEVRARLDVASTPMVAAALLPRAVRAFAISHPQVRVHLADVDMNTVRRRVLEGEADIGLGFFVKPTAGLVREPLCQFRLMRISAPTEELAGLGASRPWSSLKGLPLVSLPTDNPIQALVEKHLGRPGDETQERPRMNLIGTLIAMVHVGHAHAVVPSFALEECLRHGLSVAMLVEPAVHLDLYLISRRGAPSKPAAADFAKALRAAAGLLTK